MAYGTSEEATVAIHDLIEQNKELLGIRYVGYGEDAMFPEYPAVIVQAAPLERQLHITAGFLVRMHCDIFIYHAAWEESHAIRTLEDMELATKVRKLLDDDRSFGGNLIFSYTDGEIPGRVEDDQGGMVVATHLSWQGESRMLFTE